MPDPNVGKRSAPPRTWGDRARLFKAALHRLRVEMKHPATSPKSIPWMDALAASGDRMAAQIDAIPKAMPLPGRKAGITCSNAGCTRTVWVSADLLYLQPGLSNQRCEECAPPAQRAWTTLKPLTRDERLETAVILAVRLQGHVRALEAYGDWGGLDFMADARVGVPQRILFAIGACLDGMRSNLDSNDEADQALRDLGLGWLAGRWERMAWKGGTRVPSETGTWQASHHLEAVAASITEALKPGERPIPFDHPPKEKEQRARREPERPTPSVDRVPVRTGAQRADPRGDHREPKVVHVPPRGGETRRSPVGPRVEQQRRPLVRNGSVQGATSPGDANRVRADRGRVAPKPTDDDEWIF